MRVTSPLVLAVAVVTVACDQLLPDRAPAVAVAPPSADSAKPKSPAAARPRRRDPPPGAAEAANEGEAFSQLRRGLRRLVTAEQGFYAENGAYTEDLDRLGYRAEGPVVIKFLWLKRDGWAASARHPELPGRDCVTYVGRVTAAPTSLKFVRSAREGAAACDDTPTASRATAPSSRAPADTASALDAVSPTIMMRVDLRNLVIAQNSYLATQGLYSRRTEPLALQYLWHRGVTVRILSADNHSWSAEATHAARPGKSCVVWAGPVETRPVTVVQRKTGTAGVPVCDD